MTEKPETPVPAEADISDGESVSFARCMACVHAADIDRAAGAFICKKHDMRCDAESDAIPDDCPQFEAQETS